VRNHPLPSGHLQIELSSRDHMTREIAGDLAYSPKRPLFTSDASVQTASVNVFDSQNTKEQSNEDQDISDLSAADLAKILKWSDDISNEINLYFGWFVLSSASHKSVMLTGCLSITTSDRNCIM
jgi:hypothetical protein